MELDIHEEIPLKFQDRRSKKEQHINIKIIITDHVTPT